MIMLMNINKTVAIIKAKIHCILQKAVKKRIIAANRITLNINLKFFFIIN